MGTPFLVLLIVLTIVFAVLAIGGLPKLPGPALLKRTVFVVMAQLSAVALAATAINNWGQFYGSWSDLFGGGSHEVTTVTPSGPGERVDSVPASMVLTRWSTKDELPLRGGVFATTLNGPKSKLSTRSLIYLPPQYFDKKHTNERFPVVETIAGYPGDVPQLVNRLGYPEALNTQMRTAHVRPMILVMMRPTLAPPRDTECTNVPHGPQVETFFADDVPALLKKQLRTTSDGWGAMGHSTGGYCAAKLAMMNPRQFSTAVSISGYFTPHEDDTTGSLYGGSQKLRNDNDLAWRVTHLPPPHIYLLASIGQDEKGDEGIDANKHFISLVKSPMSAQLKVVDNGAHNFADYQVVLPDAFVWLSDHMTYPN